MIFPGRNLSIYDCVRDAKAEHSVDMISIRFSSRPSRQEHPIPFFSSLLIPHLELEQAHDLSLVFPQARGISCASVIWRLVVAVPPDATHGVHCQRSSVSKDDWAVLLVRYLHVQRQR